MAEGGLIGEVARRAELAPGQVDELYRLFEEHYDSASPERFRADLAEKEWVLLLREETRGRTVGFSTQVLMEITVAGRPLRALFSGDTIIHREYWGTQELVRTWCRFAGSLKARCGETPLYWFLISKGYRTYLYLPFFFHDFYPRPERPLPPFEKQLLDALATTRYGGAYDPESGLIEPPGPHDRLKPDLDASPKHLRNPHVAYFQERNPRYAEGVELACLAEIAPENMRGAARRELEAGIRAANGEP